MIYTSYFAAAKNLDTQRFALISIALMAPKGFSGLTYSPLAPTSKLLHDYKSGSIDEQEYIRIYNAQLDKLLTSQVVQGLNNLAGGKDIVLLCWEGKDKFCHRHLVANWLGKAGHIVSEL